MSNMDSDNFNDSSRQNATSLADGKFDNIPLLAGESPLNGNFTDQSVIKESDEDKMAPKYDDLFIEPAGDYDVVYGDYNSTMEDGSRRPYLRLTSNLPNVTRPLGGEVRLKCEAASSLPINFTWLKNLAPIDKDKHVRIRNKEFWSKLVITNLDVLDSGYYQCTASNSAGSVNTTSVLRVNPSAKANNAGGATNLGGSQRKISAAAHQKDALLTKQRPSTSSTGAQGEDYADSYDNYFDEMKQPEEDSPFHVPNNAAGTGYMPVNSDRWLDGRTFKKGECVLYQGESCRSFLAGKYVKIMSDNREDVYDIDRNLKAAMIFIQQMANVSEKCKRYSQAVACYHQFKVCDMPTSSYYSAELSPSTSTNYSVISICRKDCDDLRDRECPAELAMAAQHELVGDGPKALIPVCESLPSNPPSCLRVLEPAQSADSNIVKSKDAFIPTQTTSRHSHWCYVDTGKNYEGTASTTRSNKQCLSWAQSTSSQFNTFNYPKLKTSKNYCRNPGGQRSEPWCYTLPTFNEPITGTLNSLNFVEESCGLKKCPPNLYPEWGDNATPDSSSGSVPGQPPPLLDSLANVWKSLSSQWQFAAVSGLGGLLVLLLLICCACCCRRKSKNRRKYPSGNNAARDGAPGQHSNPSASSIISSNIKKANLAVQSCNGGSSLVNSDINSAYFRKMREHEQEEVLNPLLNYGVGTTQYDPSRGGTGQRQHFEMQHRYPAGGSWQAMPPYAQQFGQMPPFPDPQPQQYNSSPHTSTEPPEPPYQIPTIHENQLKFDHVLGEDANSILYAGEWSGGMISGATLQVAVKTTKPGASQIALENFREEVKEVGGFAHKNVIPMYGVCYLTGKTLSAIFEYAYHGDLFDFLKLREPDGTENDEKERRNNAEDFLRICSQICAGMEYIARHSYVHKDLATRNCLVGDQQNIRICDFGKMRDAYDHNYYRLNANMRVPLRWMSKEALNEAKYSQASDVFAFGVTLWEMYTYGRQPYHGVSNQQVMEMINEEVPLEIPEYCPPIVYGVMIECWHSNPIKRPSFSELHAKFQKWCTTGQTQALNVVHHQHRASSVHSGGSSSGAGDSGSAALQRASRQGLGATSSSTNSQIRGSMGILDQPGFGSVPSPAPNSNSNLAGSANTGSAQIAKLTMLSNGNSIMHSTPIDHRSHNQKGGGEPNPIAKDKNGRNRMNPKNGATGSGYLYSDDDYSSEDS